MKYHSIKLKDEFVELDFENRMYACPHPLVGLTGGTASGKSMVLTIMRDLGFACVSADQLIKKIYALDETYSFFENHYPQFLDKKNRKIDFQLLRMSFFDRPHLKKEIQNYLYPKLPGLFHQELAFLGDAYQVVIYEVPLLFERNLKEQFDLIVCVNVEQSLQLKRLMARDKIDENLARKMLSAQIPLEEKCRMSDVVIQNSENLERLKEQIDWLVKEYFVAH